MGPEMLLLVGAGTGERVSGGEGAGWGAQGSEGGGG